MLAGEENGNTPQQAEKAENDRGSAQRDGPEVLPPPEAAQPTGELPERRGSSDDGELLGSVGDEGAETGLGKNAGKVFGVQRSAVARPPVKKIIYT